MAVKRIKTLMVLILVLFVSFVGLYGCSWPQKEAVVEKGVYINGVPATENLKKAIENEKLSVIGYGFTWQYAGMPSVFFEVTPTQDLVEIANKYGINASVDSLYDVSDLDGKSYIDKLPCKGMICSLKAMKDRLVKLIPSVRLDVSIENKKGFRLMFFLPKAGMTWENTASVSREELLRYIAKTVDVKCKNIKDNMGMLECREKGVFISVGNELGSVIYGVK